MTVAQMKAIAENMMQAAKEAEAKEEQEKACKTPVAKSTAVCARANEKEGKKESPVSVIANTPKSTDLVAERKADLGALPSLNALGANAKVVEMEDMIISPLASGKLKNAFITEVTAPSAIPTKTAEMWTGLTGMMAARNIDIPKAVPQERLALQAVYDTNTRAHPGFYKFRVAASAKKLIAAAITSETVVAGWAAGEETDMFIVDRKLNAAKVMEQIRSQLGVNSNPTTVGVPREVRAGGSPAEQARSAAGGGTRRRGAVGARRKGLVAAGKRPSGAMGEP